MEKKQYSAISIVIPTYNEATNIRPLIKRIHNTLTKKGVIYELIFIDDGSTDKTCNIIRKLSLTYPIILKNKIGKKGKAFSIFEGVSLAQFDAIGMIDADLQYPPEVIPEMISSLTYQDVVVANRKDYNDSSLRKKLSKTFRLLFGKVLFGLDHDIQSGLKVFKREVIDTIKFTPSSPWTFDLEFLHRAKQAGFTIQNYDISFSKRKMGESKLHFIKQTFEIGANAIILRAKIIHPIHIPPVELNTMLGAGFHFNRKKYITHTTMPHESSALNTFTFTQKFVIFIIFVSFGIGFIAFPLITLQIFIAILSFIYFADVLFNFYLVLKSLAFPQEIKSSNEELANLNDLKLPIYTILCPLYKEARVVPQFLDAISKISWPRQKLDVILLLEEDDKETIGSINKISLPEYVRALVVPHSIPKTKPKACNYGLAHAKGEYLVIYDAEDIPDPLQLKKAYSGFQKVKKDVICLQAKLSYYNPHQNLLTRFFTAEYSLWFDVTLTGLQSINTTIPLGGTSNHFRIDNLRSIKGWDPFNVTEDADLGVRLFKKGYKTAIIDSTTLEEANSKFGSWLKQRSRWIKGYMQTYLVHIRKGASLSDSQKIHSLIFQLVIGGKIAFVLINPILWIATFSYFALYAYVGPQIEALYPSAVFYMALSSLVFGNFLFLYYYMIGVAKKGQWNLMKFVFLIPFYWLMISISAGIALYQLVFKPHYWEKTAHGLHLQNKKSGKLKILIFNWRDIRHKWAGGAEVYIHELAKRWVKDNNNVTVFSGKGNQKLMSEKIDGVQIYRRGGFYTVYVWAFLYYMFKFRGKYDVIIDSENGVPFFTPIYAKENKFLLIHHVHQEVFRKSLKPPFSWLAVFLETKFMPVIYRNVQVITVSPSSKTSILNNKLTKKAPIIIYNGVDLNLYNPGKKSEGPMVLYVGRLQYYKSLNIFINAAKKILRKIPSVEFVIAGEGGEKENLKKFANKLKISKKIKFLGRVSNKEKIKLFQRAWVFVNPSFMEGWGLTTIEAAACGTPSVASDVPGLRDSIKNPHTGILVKYQDYKKFAENILMLIGDEDLRRKMSEESLKWSYNFSWEKSAKQFLKLLY